MHDASDSRTTCGGGVRCWSSDSNVGVQRLPTWRKKMYTEAPEVKFATPPAHDGFARELQTRTRPVEVREYGVTLLPWNPASISANSALPARRACSFSEGGQRTLSRSWAT